MNFLFTTEMVLSYRVIIKRLENHYSTFASYMLVIMSVTSLVGLAGRSTLQKSRKSFQIFHYSYV